MPKYINPNDSFNHTSLSNSFLIRDTLLNMHNKSPPKQTGFKCLNINKTLIKCIYNYFSLNKNNFVKKDHFNPLFIIIIMKQRYVYTQTRRKLLSNTIIKYETNNLYCCTCW